MRLILCIFTLLLSVSFAKADQRTSVILTGDMVTVTAYRDYLGYNNFHKDLPNVFLFKKEDFLSAEFDGYELLDTNDDGKVDTRFVHVKLTLKYVLNSEDIVEYKSFKTGPMTLNSAKSLISMLATELAVVEENPKGSFR